MIVATNDNDILHRAILDGNYEVKKVFQTLSPSMDIQIASNFERLIYDINDFSDIETEKIMNEIKRNGKYKIPKDKIRKIKKDFLSASLSLEEMKKIIIKLSAATEYDTVIVDPHTAIGLGAITKAANKNKDSGVNTVNTISLATAHPAKFPEATKFAHGKVELPGELKNIINEKENFNIMKNHVKEVKDYILKKI